jgi:ABC-type dipeptide/oligopeptide/nickel transport system permease component
MAAYQYPPSGYPISQIPPRKPDNTIRPLFYFLQRVGLLIAGFMIAVVVLFLLVNGTSTRIAGHYRLSSIIPSGALFEQYAQRFGNSAILFFLALLVVIFSSGVATLLGVLISNHAKRNAATGSLLKILGRFWIYLQVALPVIILNIFLMLIIGFTWRILPTGGMYSPTGDKSLWDLFRHMIIPLAVLTSLPSVLIAQATVRRISNSDLKSGRLWGVGIFKLLSTLFNQIGGWITALVLVEIVSSWPGIGRTVYQEIMTKVRFDTTYPIFCFFMLAILIGRLLGEMFEWLGRQIEDAVQLPPPTPLQQTARKSWLTLCLILLSIPVFLAGVGLFTYSSGIEHTLSGSTVGKAFLNAFQADTNLFATGLLAAIWAAMIAGPWGLLVGYLRTKNTSMHDFFSNLVLWPVDIGLFYPILPFGFMLAVIFNPRSLHSEAATFLVGALVVMLLVLPRVILMMSHLWQAQQERKAAGAFHAVMTLILGSILLAFTVRFILDYLGLSYSSITGLPRLMQLSLMKTFKVDAGIIIPLVFTLLNFYPIWLTLDAMVGYFTSKDALVDLNR